MGFERVEGPAGEPLCLAESTCETTDLEEMRATCRVDDPPDGERDCRNWPENARLMVLFTRRGTQDLTVYDGMLCEAGYATGSAEAVGRGCMDAFGRRVKRAGDSWTVVNGWQWWGNCAPALTQPCPTTPDPIVPASCEAQEHDCGTDEPQIKGERYGCCVVVEGRGQWQDVVEAAAAELKAEARLVDASSGLRGWPPGDSDEHREEQTRLTRQYVDALAKRLMERYGVCASRRRIDDEVWIKVSNTVSEHYDVVAGWGQAHVFRTVICTPASW